MAQFVLSVAGSDRPGLASDAAQAALEAISGEIMVDITLAPAG